MKQAPILTELRSLQDRSESKAFDFLDEEFFKLIGTENDGWDAQQTSTRRNMVADTPLQPTAEKRGGCAAEPLAPMRCQTGLVE